MSHTMSPHPIFVRERVLSASGAAGRLGQDQLVVYVCLCGSAVAIGMERILPLVSSRRQHFFPVVKIGSGHRLWRQFVGLNLG